MYSKNSNLSEKQPFVLPEHYGGSAFSRPPIETKPLYSEFENSVFSPMESGLQVATPKPMPKHEAPAPAPIPQVPQKEPCEKKNSLGLGKLGLPSELVSGIKGDDLLLLGLILLLANSEKEADIIPWLALLFFCG